MPKKDKTAAMGSFFKGGSQTNPGPSAPRAPNHQAKPDKGSDDLIQFNTYLARDGVKEIRLLGVELERELRDLAKEAWNDFLVKHGRPPLA